MASTNYVYEVMSRRDRPQNEQKLVELCRTLGLQLVRVDPDSTKRTALVGKL